MAPSRLIGGAIRCDALPKCIAPLTVALTLSERSAYAHASDATLYYAENSGSFTVTAALNDTLAGLAQVAFPDTTSPGIGYAFDGDASATRSRTYTFIAASTFPSAALRAGSAATFVAATDRACAEPVEAPPT